MSNALIRLRAVAPWAVGVALLLAGPSIGLIDAAWSREIILIGILALLVSSLNLSFGYSGELALGQVAYYAVGAYVSGWLALNVTPELLIALPLASVASMLVAVVASAVTVRLGGWALAVSMFFLVLLVPDIAGLFKEQLGGFEGLVAIPLPTLAGVELTPEQFYLVAVMVTVAWLVLVGHLVSSRFGASFLVLRKSKILASSLGMSPYSLKFRALLVAAIPAGVAGTLFAFLDGFVAPTAFSLHLTITVLAASILGGPRTVVGAVLGAALIQIGPNQLTWFADYAYIAFGVFLIVGGLLFSNGIVGALRTLRSRFQAEPGVLAGHLVAPGDAPTPAVRGALLEVENVAKAFGGNQALVDAGFVARPGEITALIGANGSGKTTLFNVISGFVPADSGSVRLGGEQILGLPPHGVARQGVARTFQTPLVPEGLTVEQAVQTAVFAQRPLTMPETMLRLPRHHASRRHEVETARAALDALGLTGIATRQAADIPLGTRRLLELARALASNPKVILLDEVASGLDEHELIALEHLLARLAAAGATVVLVEHNFALVRRVADHVVVLAQGQVVVDGAAEEVASHPFVQHTYLAGSRHADQDRVAVEGAAS
ncbi:ATP-binding cassette domain-containing protein [Micromonospora sp. HUAS LYJ1]|uniref:branched-chain amino acid ABC transporter ATP-binding protein/permease n=1 Tax=Micromonospora sp. HUAS LYJ1 TaxID=3061626 RepID=UPI00267309F0|nr:ATP-binding cassette domain-containing protein [Micromonospora sp. HUAS LYJ1]WKU03533.1 ATP-binding cassette domain-containing protein [Micromonospora sp. HUAS LYJ1]